MLKLLLLLFIIFGFFGGGDKFFTDLIEILGWKKNLLLGLLFIFMILSLFLDFFFSLYSTFCSLLLYLCLLILFFETDKGNIVLYLFEFLFVLLNILFIKNKELTLLVLLLFKFVLILFPLYLSSFFVQPKLFVEKKLK